MPELIQSPVQVTVPGGKVVAEHIGRASTGHEIVSVAHAKAPAGWGEPFQVARFDEVTLVLSGTVLVEHEGGQAVVRAGQSLITRAGERVRYTVGDEAAEYVSVCLPAFDAQQRQREG